MGSFHETNILSQHVSRCPSPTATDKSLTLKKCPRSFHETSSCFLLKEFLADVANCDWYIQAWQIVIGIYRRNSIITNAYNCPTLMPKVSTEMSMDAKRSSDFNWAFTLAAGFLTFNTVVAIVRMREDILAVTFTISFFVFLMIFFWCLSVFEKSPQDSKEKERLKAPIWFLATSLNVMFAYRVWTIIQPSMALGWLVWGMAGTTSVITFYFFFVYGEKKIKTADCDSRVLYPQQV